MGALIPLILMLIKGASIGSILTGLSLTQWIDIAGGMITAGPKVIQQLQAIHQVFGMLGQHIEAGRSADQVGVEAKMYFVQNPEDEPDRTQEDIDQDNRIGRLERELAELERALRAELAKIDERIHDLETAHGP